MRLRYLFVVFFFATGWFIASIEDSAAAGCRAPRDATDFQVHVDVQVAEPQVFNHMSKAELGTTNSHGGERQILGTTQSGFSLSWSINYQVANWKNVYCFWTSSAEVELAYQTLDVNIAAEYEAAFIRLADVKMTGAKGDHPWNKRFQTFADKSL